MRSVRPWFWANYTVTAASVITQSSSTDTNQMASVLFCSVTPKMGNLQITSPHPVAPLRYYLWQLAVLAMSTPLRSTIFEEYTRVPSHLLKLSSYSHSVKRTHCPWDFCTDNGLYCPGLARPGNMTSAAESSASLLIQNCIALLYDKA